MLGVLERGEPAVEEGEEHDNHTGVRWLMVEKSARSTPMINVFEMRTPR